MTPRVLRAKYANHIWLADLTEILRPIDHVSIVVYAGASGLVLPPTPGNQRSRILAALDRLAAGGSTHGAAGIRLAYDTAARHFDADGINRVILATDGDFNVGTTSRSDLVDLIEEKRETGVFLTVLGVGRGNLNDAGRDTLYVMYVITTPSSFVILVEIFTVSPDVHIENNGFQVFNMLAGNQSLLGGSHTAN